MILQIATLVFLIPAVLVCTYFIFLALISSITRRKNINNIATDFTNTFAIIIPAHNEEKFILDTLVSISDLNYPADKFEIFVIADNCSDKTAAIAANFGAEVLVRNDDEKVGKGFALEWAFEKLLKRKFNAYMVIDADCKLHKDALSVFNIHLQDGANVIQANYTVANPDENIISLILSIGNKIENTLFYSPKSFLNLSVLLRGTGMVFKRWVLEKYPWQAYSIVEDVEYSIDLIKNNIDIIFIDRVIVSSNFPSSISQLQVQRSRWASGNLRMAKMKSIKLIMEGLKTGHFKLIDAGWTLITLSKPLIIVELTITLILATLSFIFVPSVFSNILLLSALIVLLVFYFYILLGFILLGITKDRLLMLPKIPVIAMNLILISIFGFIKSNKTEWERTPR